MGEPSRERSRGFAGPSIGSGGGGSRLERPQLALRAQQRLLKRLSSASASNRASDRCRRAARSRRRGRLKRHAGEHEPLPGRRASAIRPNSAASDGPGRWRTASAETARSKGPADSPSSRRATRRSVPEERGARASMASLYRLPAAHRAAPLCCYAALPPSTPQARPLRATTPWGIPVIRAGEKP